MISGTYVGQSGDLQLMLRMDVDGARPMNIISGDLFRSSGGRGVYVDSFMIKSVQSSQTGQGMEFRGVGSSAYSGAAYAVDVAVALGASGGSPGQIAAMMTIPGHGQFTAVCNYVSRAFRRVAVNSAFEQNSVIFTEFDTTSDPEHPPDVVKRTVNLITAYADAGIELYEDLPPVMVQPAEGNVNDTWSDAELHAAMQSHFSTFSDDPQWRLFVLFVDLHVEQGYIGLMFDTHDAHQRQGCAIFTRNSYLTDGTQAQKERAFVWATAHEVGHCFNLLHSFAKGPNAPSEPDALSFMNYPYNYDALPGKQAGDFWRNFRFQFVDEEVVHLRHRELPFVIMGGAPLEVGSEALLPKGWDEKEKDRQRRASVRLEANAQFEFGEPVYIEASLRPPANGGTHVFRDLNPRHDHLRILIMKPSGAIVEYRPPLVCDAVAPPLELEANGTPSYESIYIGYGRDGFYFLDPGKYTIRACYFGTDGRESFSNSITIEILPPPTGEEQALATNLIGHQQGLIFYFGGSDFLAEGNMRLQEQLIRMPNGATARHIHRCLGLNASRPFKIMTPQNRIYVREASPTVAVRHLETCLTISATTAASPLGNILFRQAAERLATVRMAAGDQDRAELLVKNVGGYFARQGIRPDVMKTIKQSLGSCLRGGDEHEAQPERYRRGRTGRGSDWGDTKPKTEPTGGYSAQKPVRWGAEGEDRPDPRTVQPGQGKTEPEGGGYSGEGKHPKAPEHGHPPKAPGPKKRRER